MQRRECKRESIGDKPYAFDLHTGEKWGASEAKKHTEYRFDSGLCYRVDANDCESFFRYYDEEEHRLRGVPHPGAGESLAHEEAILWVLERKLVTAALNKRPMFMTFSNVVDDRRADRSFRRPDIKATVEDCWPRYVAPQTEIYIEICVRNPVTEERERDLALDGLVAIEIFLDKTLSRYKQEDIRANVRGFQQRLSAAICGCPPARIIYWPARLSEIDPV